METDTLQELYQSVARLYQSSHSIQYTADTLHISFWRVRKILITMGIYHTEEADEIYELKKSGKSIAEIAQQLGKSIQTISSLLPYEEEPFYGLDSVENTNRHSYLDVEEERLDALRRLRECPSDDQMPVLLWHVFRLYAGETFHTSRKLPFTYKIKGKELFVDRKEGSKSITLSTVLFAYKKVISEQKEGPYVTGPKQLNVFGAPYIWSILRGTGLLELPDKNGKQCTLY